MMELFCGNCFSMAYKNKFIKSFNIDVQQVPMPLYCSGSEDIISFQPSTSYLLCTAKQMTGFHMKYNIGLSELNQSYQYERELYLKPFHYSAIVSLSKPIQCKTMTGFYMMAAAEYWIRLKYREILV